MKLTQKQMLQIGVVVLLVMLIVSFFTKKKIDVSSVLIDANCKATFSIRNYTSDKAMVALEIGAHAKPSTGNAGGEIARGQGVYEVPANGKLDIQETVWCAISGGVVKGHSFIRDISWE